MTKVPKRYIPNQLTEEDALKQIQEIKKSQKLYKKILYKKKIEVFQFKNS